MTDKTTLSQMSKDVLVIPFSDETAEKIDKFCCGQIEGIDTDRVEELILSFLNRKSDSELQKAFEKYATENEMVSDLSIEAIMPVIAEYIVLKVIEDCEDEGDRALFSLMLKNALILAVKGEGFVANAQAVANMFGYYFAYLTDEKSFEKEDNNAVSELLEADDDSFSEKWADVDGDIAKAIVFDAVQYRYKNFVDALKVDTENIIKGAYILVNQLVKNSPWLYADIEPAQTINQKLGEAGTRTVTLTTVKEELKGIVEKDGDEYRLTSVLLRLIVDDDEDIALAGSTELTISELAVYLYYELLVEAICENKEENEE